MRQWFVVCTDPRAEERVAWTLKALNFGVFLPMESSTKKERGTGRRIKVYRPVFKRYVFVAFDIDGEEWWNPIKSVFGVQRLIENRGLPVSVPDGLIAELKRHEANGLFDKDKLPTAGERYRVVEGSLAGQVGRVVRTSRAGDRARLLFQMLGGLVPADIEIEHLERI